MDVSIVIPTKNGGHLFEKVLDAVFKQNALGYRHTGFVVRRVFGRAVERRHEADIQQISIRAGDGFTDFCFCNAHILIRSVGMHGKILEEAADGVSA